VFTLVFQSASPVLFAADAAPKKATPKKRKPKKKSAKKSESKETAAKPTKSKKGRTLKKIQSGEAVPTVEKPAVLSAPSSDTPWGEPVDVLSPDDNSPVLADSIFGAKGKVRINLIADNIEAKSIMDHIATEYKINIVSKELKDGNRVKTSLYDLPLETIFQVLLEQANLEYEKKHGIIYLRDREGDQYFLEERFFKITEFADWDFAKSIIESIAKTKGKNIIENKANKTFFIVERKRNLIRIENMLKRLGYLDELNPDENVYHYHYLSYSYVDEGVATDIAKKFKTEHGKASTDPKSKRVIVFDTKRAFRKMKEALSFVDVPRGQVFIDVMFVDLTESDKKRLGVDMQIDWNQDQANNADQLLTSLSSDVTNFFSLKTPNHLSNFKVTGIKEHSRSNILNNPKLMVLNQEKATIDVTEKFPYVVNENSNGVISSQINEVPIGVLLTVTPEINANREVLLDVNPKITVLKQVKTIVTKVIDTNQSNAKPTETSSEFPILDERSITTKVVVPSGKTLVIGGLIKETDRNAADKIPGLANLPVLGPLFKRKDRGQEKSQLYVFITPTIVRNAPKSSAFSNNYGKERLSYFPDKSSDREKKKLSGLVLEESRDSNNNVVEPTDLDKPLSSKGEPQDMGETPVLVQKQSPKSESSSIDFSKFIKKISRLKNKQRMDDLKSADVKAKAIRKEQGFDKLLTELKVDIKEEEKAAKIKAQTQKEEKQKEKKKQIKKSDIEKKEIRDKVLGEKAARISKLLERWESRPRDGVMSERPSTKPSEDKGKTALSQSQLSQQASETAKAKEAEKKAAEQAAKVEKKKQEAKAKARIKLDFMSPFDEGELDRKKLLIDGGAFSFGELELKIPTRAGNTKGKTTKKKKKSRPKKKRALKKKKVSYVLPDTNNQTFEMDFSNALKNDSRVVFSSEQEWPEEPVEVKASVAKVVEKQVAKKVPVRRQRPVQKMEKTFTMDDELSFERPTEKKIAQSIKKAPLKQDKFVKRTVISSEDDWETAFFENNLARVSVTTIDEAVDNDEVRVVPQKQVPVKKKAVPLRKPQRIAKTPQKIVVPEVKKVKAPISKGGKKGKALKFDSPDARTQQIFSNLFANKKEKPMGTVQQTATSEPAVTRNSLEVARTIIDNGNRPAPARTAVKKNTSKLKIEQEFAAFLNEALVEDSSPKTALAPVIKKPVAEKKEKQPDKVSKSEQEFMDFLEQM
jgi:hypothetical protein